MKAPILYQLGAYFASLPSWNFTPAGLWAGFRKFWSSALKSILAVAASAFATALLSGLSQWQQHVQGDPQSAMFVVGTLIAIVLRGLISNFLEWVNTQPSVQAPVVPVVPTVLVQPEVSEVSAQG